LFWFSGLRFRFVAKKNVTYTPMSRSSFWGAPLCTRLRGGRRSRRPYGRHHRCSLKTADLRTSYTQSGWKFDENSQPYTADDIRKYHSSWK
jgi:hypothetical protein